MDSELPDFLTPYVSKVPQNLPDLSDSKALNELAPAFRDLAKTMNETTVAAQPKPYKQGITSLMNAVEAANVPGSYYYSVGEDRDKHVKWVYMAGSYPDYIGIIREVKPAMNLYDVSNMHPPGSTFWKQVPGNIRGEASQYALDWITSENPDSLPTLSTFEFDDRAILRLAREIGRNMNASSKNVIYLHYNVNVVSEKNGVAVSHIFSRSTKSIDFGAYNDKVGKSLVDAANKFMTEIIKGKKDQSDVSILKALVHQLQVRVFENIFVGSFLTIDATKKDRFFNPQTNTRCVIECLTYVLGPEIASPERLATCMGFSSRAGVSWSLLGNIFNYLIGLPEVKTRFMLFNFDKEGLPRHVTTYGAKYLTKYTYFVVYQNHMMVALDPGVVNEMRADWFYTEKRDLNLEERLEKAEFKELKHAKLIGRKKNNFEIPMNRIAVWDCETASDNTGRQHMIAVQWLFLNQIYGKYSDREDNGDINFSPYDPPNLFINKENDILPAELTGKRKCEEDPHFYVGPSDEVDFERKGHNQSIYGPNSALRFSQVLVDLMNKIKRTISFAMEKYMNEVKFKNFEDKKKKLEYYQKSLEEKNRVYFYAHNGAKFDVYVLLSEVNKVVANMTSIVKHNGGYISLMIGNVIELRDSRKHLTAALESLCKTYFVPRAYMKGSMPYKFYKFTPSDKEVKLYRSNGKFGEVVSLPDSEEYRTALRSSLYYRGSIQATKGCWKEDWPEIPKFIDEILYQPPTENWWGKTSKEKMLWLKENGKLTKALESLFEVYMKMEPDKKFFSTIAWRKKLEVEAYYAPVYDGEDPRSVYEYEWYQFKLYVGETHVDFNKLTPEQKIEFNAWAELMSDWCERNMVNFTDVINGVWDARTHALRYMANDIIGLGIVLMRYSYNMWQLNNGQYPLEFLSLPAYAYHNLMADINFDMSKKEWFEQQVEILKDLPKGKKAIKKAYNSCKYESKLQLIMVKDYNFNEFKTDTNYGGRVFAAQKYYANPLYTCIKQAEEEKKDLAAFNEVIQLEPEDVIQPKIGVGINDIIWEKIESLAKQKSEQELRDAIVELNELAAKRAFERANKLESDKAKVKMLMGDLFTESEFMKIKDNLDAIDATSLYPAAMFVGLYPVGKCYFVNKSKFEEYRQKLNNGGELDRLCMMEVDIVYTSRDVILPIIPTKIADGQTVYDCFDKFKRRFNNVDLQQFIKYNPVQISRIHHILEWPGKRAIFKDVITKWFVGRQEMKKQKNDIGSEMLKLLMNSSFGKTIQDLIRHKTLVLEYEEACLRHNQGVLGEEFEIWGTYDEADPGGHGGTKIVLQVRTDDENASEKELDGLITRCPELGSFILAYSRKIMNEVIETIGGFKEHKVFYGDTDSIYIMRSDYLKLKYEPIEQGEILALRKKMNEEKDLKPHQKTAGISKCGLFKHRLNSYGMTWVTVSDNPDDSFLTQFHDDTDSKVDDPKIIQFYALEPKVKCVEYICEAQNNKITMVDDERYTNPAIRIQVAKIMSSIIKELRRVEKLEQKYAKVAARRKFDEVAFLKTLSSEQKKAYEAEKEKNKDIHKAEDEFYDSLDPVEPFKSIYQIRDSNILMSYNAIDNLQGKKSNDDRFSDEIKMINEWLEEWYKKHGKYVPPFIDESRKVWVILKTSALYEPFGRYQASKKVVTKGEKRTCVKHKTTFKGFHRDARVTEFISNGKVVQKGLNLIPNPSVFESIAFFGVSAKIVYEDFIKGKDSAVRILNTEKVVCSKPWAGRYHSGIRYLPWGSTFVPSTENVAKFSQLAASKIKGGGSYYSFQ